MKTLFLLILQFAFISLWSQNDYTITIYDKNTKKQIPATNFIQTDSTISFNYDTEKLIFDIPKKHLLHKYLYIYIDTVKNKNQTFVLDVRDKYNTLYFDDVNDSIEHFHVVRNLNYSLKNSKTAFSGKDFFYLFGGKDIYLNANVGYAYSGLLVGVSLKYFLYFSLYGKGFNLVTLNMEYSNIQSGSFKSAQELGLGVRALLPVPIGLQLNTFYFDNKYSLQLRPEVGFDIASFSLIYGYNIGLSNNHDLATRNRHYAKISFGINLSRPIKKYFHKFPYGSY